MTKTKEQEATDAVMNKDFAEFDKAFSDITKAVVEKTQPGSFVLDKE